MGFDCSEKYHIVYLLNCTLLLDKDPLKEVIMKDKGLMECLVKAQNII